MRDTNPVADLPSGRFVLRIDPGLHAALREAARQADMSLNEYCGRKLASPGGDVAAPALEVVERATSILGDAVVGIVVFGSWARDELWDRSDVDVLVIVEAGVPITRALYRAWDEAPLRWGSLSVEPRFVRLPEVCEGVSGTWAEVALEGLVLFERGLAVSRLLADLRRRIVTGRFIRRRAHGQPYWIEAA